MLLPLPPTFISLPNLVCIYLLAKHKTRILFGQQITQNYFSTNYPNYHEFCLVKNYPKWNKIENQKFSLIFLNFGQKKNSPQLCTIKGNYSL